MKRLKVWRIIAPLALLLTFSGCLGGFFEKPDYASLVVDSIEETYDGIRIRIQNIGTQDAQIVSVMLRAKDSTGTVKASEPPTSRQNDDAWFSGVELREESPGIVHQFIPVDALVEGWAFEEVFDDISGIITDLQVEIEWMDSSTFIGKLNKSYTVPYYRMGETWEDDE